MENFKFYTLPKLEKQLRDLGVAQGDKLAVHSSYKACGPVEGGPATVVRALMHAVGDTGTILMPIFVGLPVETYSPKQTPSSCGIITEMFRCRKDVKYSYHPTHAVAVWGKDADWIARAHSEGRNALGVDSPFDRLTQSGGKVLLIGVGHNRNSLIHVGEAHFKVPYTGVYYSKEFEGYHRIKTEDGTVKKIMIYECPGCSENFQVVEDYLKKHHKITYGYINKTISQLVVGVDVITTVKNLLSQNIESLLCRNPGCCVCPRKRNKIRGEETLAKATIRTNNKLQS